MLTAERDGLSEDLKQVIIEEFQWRGMPGVHLRFTPPGMASMLHQALAFANAHFKLGLDSRQLEEFADTGEAHQTKVRAERDRMRARDEALALLRAERDPAPPINLRTLKDALAEPRPPLQFTIDGLHVAGANTLLVGSFKAGKTTLALNLVKALADDEPFLGAFPVDPPPGRIAYLNYEVGHEQILAWFDDLGIVNQDRVAVVSLRGLRLPFWLPHVRTALVGALRAQDVGAIILDPLGRAWRGLVTNENDNANVRDFTDAVDELKVAADVRDAFLVHHMGRQQHEDDAEHSRGATTLEDWMDGGLYITNKERDGTRMLRAVGRDVAVPATALSFDEATRELSWTGRTRAEHRQELGLPRALGTLREMEDDAGVALKDRTTKAWKSAIGGNATAATDAIRVAKEKGYVKITPGANNAQCVTLTKKGRAQLRGAS